MLAITHIILLIHTGKLCNYTFRYETSHKSFTCMYFYIAMLDEQHLNTCKKDTCMHEYEHAKTELVTCHPTDRISSKQLYHY